MSTEKKKSFWEKYVFEDKEDKGANPVPETEQPVGVVPQTETVIPGAVAQPTQVTQSSDDRATFLEHINTVMKNFNLPGPDYYEFMLGLRALDNVPIDDKTKVSTVMATLAAQGATKEMLASTAAEYISTLESDKTKFMESLIKQANKKIGSLEESVAGGNQRMLDIDAEIKNLIAEKAELQTRVLSDTAELQTAKLKVDSYKTTYDAVFNETISRINADVQKINTYL